MTECYSARCQQDRKLARREFNKWTKNLLLQIGLETIAKNHFEYDVNLFNQSNEEQIPVDFNPNSECLFCLNRQEYLGNKKSFNRTNEIETIIDDDENIPLDLSLKSTNKSPIITSNNRNNMKHRPFIDIKSDIPPMYGQEEFDRFMSEMIASQLEYSSQPFFNFNLFPTSPTIPVAQTQLNKKKPSSIQDARIAQLAKQMAYERMLEEINSQRHKSTNKKSKTSMNSSSSSSILTESIHVNHLLNDVMRKILHEMCEKQQQQQQQIPQPRASRQGELLFVKKQNVNNDEQYSFNHTKPQHKHVNPSSSSSSSSSSISSNSSSKNKAKSSVNYIPKGRSIEMNNNNSKILIGMDGKQIRPKRGQYRRYESEQLAKAVAAVLSNEMSVHKAGSYFGVPHSTLEYKVKERNTKMSSTNKPKNEDEDDEKSSKGLTTFLPPSNSSINNDDDDDDDI